MNLRVRCTLRAEAVEAERKKRASPSPRVLFAPMSEEAERKKEAGHDGAVFEVAEGRVAVWR